MRSYETVNEYDKEDVPNVGTAIQSCVGSVEMLCDSIEELHNRMFENVRTNEAKAPPPEPLGFVPAAISILGKTQDRTGHAMMLIHEIKQRF